MNRLPVNSTRVKSIGWKNNILEVEFTKGGAIYQYYNVQYDEYIALLQSDSIGKSISKLDKKHPYLRID